MSTFLWALLVLAIWLPLAFVFAVALGRGIRQVDLASTSLTDDELEVCRWAPPKPSGHGFQILRVGEGHLLAVDRDARTIKRLYRDRDAVRVAWPLDLM